MVSRVFRYGHDFFLNGLIYCSKAFLSNSTFGHFSVVTHHGDFIGYLVLTAGFTFDHVGKDAFIDELYIQEAYRNQGIGKQLMDFVQVEGIKLGFRALYLEVEHDNDAAESLYNKVGFKSTGRRLLQKSLY